MGPGQEDYWGPRRGALHHRGGGRPGAEEGRGPLPRALHLSGPHHQVRLDSCKDEDPDLNFNKAIWSQ